MKKLYILFFALFMVNGAIGQWFWQNPFPQGNLLSSVFFTDANTGYAVGNVGTILKTLNGGYTGGINDHNQTVANLIIYPNPTSSTIVIVNIEKGKLSILNLGGQHLLQQQITAPVTNIDVSNLPNGIYMVKVVGEKGVQTGKFVKL